MKGEKLLVTKKDIKRFKVLKNVIEKKLKGTQAAQLLCLSVVHVSRLKKRLLAAGFEGLGHVGSNLNILHICRASLC